MGGTPYRHVRFPAKADILLKLAYSDPAKGGDDARTVVARGPAGGM